jgi:hypothetical protein
LPARAHHEGGTDLSLEGAKLLGDGRRREQSAPRRLGDGAVLQDREKILKKGSVHGRGRGRKKENFFFEERLSLFFFSPELIKLPTIVLRKPYKLTDAQQAFRPGVPPRVFF